MGFVFKDNEITAIVKDSSAARNGVLTDHHLLEVDGQNVVGLKVRSSSCVLISCYVDVTRLIYAYDVFCYM